MVYWSTESWTYVAQVSLPTQQGMQDYSLFFSLTKNKESVGPALNMFVKSAYLRGLDVPPNTNSYRFNALIGLTSGVYQKKKKERPKPQGKGKKGRK
jgi:hypothetical protein